MLGFQTNEDFFESEMVLFVVVVVVAVDDASRGRRLRFESKYSYHRNFDEFKSNFDKEIYQ